MYKKGNQVLSVEEAEARAKSADFNVNEWASLFGWELSEEGKTNGSTETTPPIGPEKIDTAVGDSSLADTSLESPDFNPYLLTEEDLIGKEDEVAAKIQKKLAAIGLTADDAFTLDKGVRILDESAAKVGKTTKKLRQSTQAGPLLTFAPQAFLAEQVAGPITDRLGSSVSGKLDDKNRAETLEKLNSFIKEKGDLSYANQFETEENKNLIDNYIKEYQEIKPTSEEDAINAIKEEQKPAELPIGTKIGAKIKPKEEIKVTEDQIAQKKFALDQEAINNLNKSYYRNLSSSERKAFDIVTNKYITDLSYKAENINESRKIIEDSALDIENQIKNFEQSPQTTIEDRSKLESNILAHQEKVNNYNNLINLLKDPSTEALSAATDATFKDYSLLNKLDVSTKDVASTIGFTAAKFVTAGALARTGASLEDADKFTKELFKPVFNKLEGERSRLAEAPTGALTFKGDWTLKDYIAWAGNTAVEAAPSLALAFTGPAAMPLFFASGYGGKQKEFALQDWEAADGLAKIKETLERGTDINGNNLTEEQIQELNAQGDEYSKTLEMPNWKKETAATLAGGAEVIFERLTTMNLIKGWSKIANPLSVKQGVASFLKKAPLEGLGEGATELSNNVVDIVLLDEDKNPFEGVSDAAAGGLLIGAPLAVNAGRAKLTYNYLVSGLQSKSDSKFFKDKFSELETLTGVKGVNSVFDLNLLPDDASPRVKELVEELNKEIGDKQQEIVDRLGKEYNVEDAYNIFEIVRQQKKLNKQFAEVAAAGVRGSELNAARDILKKKFDALEDQRQELLTKDSKLDRLGLETKSVYQAITSQQRIQAKRRSDVKFDRLNQTTKEEYLNKAEGNIDNAKEDYFVAENKKAILKNKEAFEGISSEYGIKPELLSDAQYKKLAKAEPNSEALIDENNKVYINLDLAAKNGRVGVVGHELLHAITKSKLKTQGKANQAGKDLLGWLEQNAPETFSYVDARLQGLYEGNQAYYEEAINALSDYIAEGNSVDLNTLSKLKVFFNNIFKKQKTNVEFSKPLETFAFVAKYANKNKTAEVEQIIKKWAVQNDEDTKRQTAAQSLGVPLSTSQLTKVKERLGNITKENLNNTQSQNTIANELFGMVETQIRNRFTLNNDIVQELQGDVIERVYRANENTKWDGRGTLYGFLNGRISKRILDAIKANPDYLDLVSKQELTGLEKAAEVTVDPVETIDKPVDTKPEFKKLTEYKGNKSFISEEAMPEVNTVATRIVGGPSFKAKFDQRAPDGKQTSDFIAALKKQFGNSILVDRIKSKGIVKTKTGTATQAFERFMLQNKKAILENMTTTYLQTAFPHAVEKSVNGVFVRFPNWLGQKIDRETTGQGNDLVRRVPNVAQTVSDQQYLEDIRTNPLKDGKEVRSAAKQNSVLKAIAEEMGIEIVTEAINNPNSDIYKALVRRQGELGITEDQITAVEAQVQAERGNVKFSKGTQELLTGNTQQISDEFLELEGRNKTDTLLKRFELKGVYKFKTEDQVNEFINDLENNVLKTMPRSFWFPTEKGSPLLHSSKVIGASSSDNIWKYYQQEINKLRKLDDNNFGDPIVDKNGNTITDFTVSSYNTLFGSETKVLANKKNGKINEFNNKVSAIHEAMWMRFRDAIKQNKNNARPIAQFLNFSTSNRNHWQRLGAQFVGYSKGFKSGKENVTFEHAMPNIAAYLYLLDAAVNNYNFEGAYNAIISNYKLIALDKQSDNKLSGAYKTGMPKGWSVRSGYWFQRYFNELIASNDGGIDPSSIVLLSGRTLGETVGVTANGTVLSAKGIEFDNKINKEALQKATEEYSKDYESKGVKYSKGLSEEFNNIIERTTGVEAFKEFSRIQAQMRGAKKGKYKYFVAPSADDFRGLVNYAFAGKGKRGEADMKFLEEKLMQPYMRGIAAINSARQQIKTDFRTTVKTFKNEYKLLNKPIGESTFTNDHAVRLYLWEKQGTKVEGLSKRDKALLQKAIADNPSLAEFADALMAISKQEKWAEPGEYWEGGTVLSDLNGMTEKANRKTFISEFIENADVIFTEANLNKIEAIYGTPHRQAIEDSLYAMKNGSNRPTGNNAQVNKWLNWINNSTGAIMFFNRRSAVLQMLSFTNFVNLTDNNVLKAAKAFANQKQFWTDFSMIFNSDKLRERRGGLKQDVNASEIANIAKDSNNSPQAVLKKLLKLGFLPNQIADSFAISLGGASFYRNRVNTYLKEGMNKKDAETKAFEDFSKLSDEAQQSADPALVSQVQRSVLGRLVFAFQNTPMQYTRLMKKAGQDLINKRGDWKTHVSKILYYGAIQNFIFSALQSALFALIPGFDDDDEEKLTEKEQKQNEQKIIRILNNMGDTVLRGSGVYGAVASTLKNIIMEYSKQQEKGWMSDHTYTILAAAGISPPISSKLRKLYNAIQTKKFNKDEIEARGWAVGLDGKLNLGPNYEIVGSLVESTLNVPLARTIDEVNSITEALDSRNTAFQRIALALGWRTWDVGAIDEEAELIKDKAKEARSKAKKSAKEKTSEKRTVKRKTVKRQTVRRK